MIESPEIKDVEEGRLPTLAEMERRLIRKAWRRLKGNVTHMAEALGISRRSLQMKLKEYGYEDWERG